VDGRADRLLGKACLDFRHARGEIIMLTRFPSVFAAFLVTLMLALPGPPARAQTDRSDSYSSSGRSRLRDLRDSHRDSQSESTDINDLRKDFGSLRQRYNVENTRQTRPGEVKPPERPETGPNTPPTKPGTRTRPTPPRSGRPEGIPYSVVPGRAAEEGGKPPEITSTNPILYFDQPDLYVAPGDPFDVELRLSNPNSETFDSVAVTLAYDPTKMELLDSAPDADEPEINGARQELIDRYSWLTPDSDLYSDDVDLDGGRIDIRLRTPEGKTDILEGTIGRFRFVPLADSGEIPLKFVFTGNSGEPLTYLRLGGKDILGSPNRSEDGVLDALFRVNPLVSISGEPELPSGDYRTRIVFDPPQAELAMGDLLQVDIVLDNPNEVPFDNINLVIGYNPKVLKVVDDDMNNWIKDGININDSDSIALFPFTDRERNTVYPREGVILYRSSSPENALRSEGVLATIRLLAIGTTGADGSPFQIGYHPAKEALNSGLFYRGRDVLGDSEDDRDGFGGFRAYVDRRQVTRRDNVWDRLRKLE